MTKIFESYDDYKEIIDVVRSRIPNYITNFYLLRESVKRLIVQKRLYYELYNEGILILSDEISYYQCYFFWDKSKRLIASNKNKKIVFSFIYLDQLRDKELEGKKADLISNGYYTDAILRQVIGAPSDVYKKIEPMTVYANKLMKKNGVTIEKLSKKNLKSAMECISILDDMPLYQMPYLSDDEWIAGGEAGDHICAVNSEGMVVGVAGTYYDKSGSSYIGIMEEYRLLSGIAVVLSGELLLHLIRNNIHVTDWIDVRNRKSISYHQSIGYRFGNRILEYIVKDN